MSAPDRKTVLVAMHDPKPDALCCILRANARYIAARLRAHADWLERKSPGDHHMIRQWADQLDPQPTVSNS